jgi:hypothetical protein
VPSRKVVRRSREHDAQISSRRTGILIITLLLGRKRDQKTVTVTVTVTTWSRHRGEIQSGRVEGHGEELISSLIIPLLAQVISACRRKEELVVVRVLVISWIYLIDRLLCSALLCFALPVRDEALFLSQHATHATISHQDRDADLSPRPLPLPLLLLLSHCRYCHACPRHSRPFS